MMNVGERREKQYYNVTLYDVNLANLFAYALFLNMRLSHGSAQTLQEVPASYTGD